MRKRYYTKNRENQHRWSKIASDWYGFGAYYDKSKERYIRYYRGRISKDYKKICNRKFRRKRFEYKEDYLPKGNRYKKFSEFWWSID